MYIVASAPTPKALGDLRKRLQARKVTMENARRVGLGKIRDDVSRIAKRETEYTQKLLEAWIPVRVSIDPSFLQTLADVNPIKVEWVRDDTPNNDLNEN